MLIQSTTEVLITFYCRTGATERLALAAAVGAVQARGNIRLRRLLDVLPATPGGHEALTRMCKEYVPPTEADVLRADAIVFAAPADFAPDAREWREYFALLTRLGSEGRLRGKAAAILAETEQAQEMLSAAILQAGFTIPWNDTDATSLGRRITTAAQALKQSQSGR